jgi:hypothetical protein
MRPRIVRRRSTSASALSRARRQVGPWQRRRRTDGRYHGAGDEWADARTVINWRHPRCHAQNLDLFGDVFDTLIKTPPIAAESSMILIMRGDNTSLRLAGCQVAGGSGP